MPYYSKRKRTGSVSSRKKSRTSFRRGSYARKTAGPKYRRWTKKRNVRGFRNVVSSARWPGLTLPAKVMKKFEYEDVKPLDSTVTNLGRVWIYRTNDIYDPSFSGTLTDSTVQNFGTFCNVSMYRKWRVFGCKVKATFINTGGSQAMVVPLLSTYEALPADLISQATVEDLAATPQAAEPVFIGPLTSGTNIVTRTYYTAPWVPMGISRVQYSADHTTSGDYNARAGGDGSYLSFVMVGLGSQATVTIRVSITYYAQLFDLAMGVDTLTPAAEGS